MFCKASTIPVSEEFTESSELQLFSFDPEKTPLFFLPVEKSAKAARLPLGTAVICVARAAIAETGLPLFPRDEEVTDFFSFFFLFVPFPIKKTIRVCTWPETSLMWPSF
jgi:hypothetical protein